VRSLAAALHLVARVVAAIAAVLALIIALGILFRILAANPDNAIVSFINDLARGLVGPFDGMFKPRARKVEIAVNWGIALLVYLIVGTLLARVVHRLAGRAATRGAKRDRAADTERAD
jgi:hypothetical protein